MSKPLKHPSFFYNLKLILLITFISILIISYSSYSVNLFLNSQNIVRGGLAEYVYDSGDERVRSTQLLFSGDAVTGVTVTCSKPIGATGYYIVSVRFSNGLESVSKSITVYQGRGSSFTVTIYFDRPINYYPSPKLEAEVYRV